MALMNRSSTYDFVKRYQEVCRRIYLYSYYSTISTLKTKGFIFVVEFLSRLYQSLYAN